jgi:cytochrome c oxidase subunit 4
MAHGHGHGGHGGGHGHGESAVHGPDFVPVAAVHPAGASDSASHHGHTIVAASTLMIVLICLVGLTLLTVGAALLEAWLVDTFHVQPELATIINVTICLTIAAIKTTLVVMFFMQLKYDNPINTMIFLFCLGTVACFLGFTMLDLGNRSTIDRFKAQYVSPGGLGFATPAVQALQKTNPDLQPTKPITALAKDVAVLERNYHPDAHAHGGHGKKKPSKYSGPNQSRPIKGIPDDEPATDHH